MSTHGQIVPRGSCASAVPGSGALAAPLADRMGRRASLFNRMDEARSPGGVQAAINSSIHTSGRTFEGEQCAPPLPIEPSESLRFRGLSRRGAIRSVGVVGSLREGGPERLSSLQLASVVPLR